MKISELINWLQTFDGDKNLSIIIGDPKKRIIHKIEHVGFFMDEPAIMVEVDGTEPMEIIERNDENE